MIDQLTDWDKAKIYFQTRDVSPRDHLQALRDQNWAIKIRRDETKQYDSAEIKPEELFRVQLSW